MHPITRSDYLAIIELVDRAFGHGATVITGHDLNLRRDLLPIADDMIVDMIDVSEPGFVRITATRLGDHVTVEYAFRVEA